MEDGMRTVTCSCNASFSAELPDSIDLDASPEYLEHLSAGSFMSVACPTCGRKLKPEFLLNVVWPSKSAALIAVPELDRPNLAETVGEEKDASVVVGYPELAERIAVLDAGLDPTAIEILKYYLLLKAAEADPNAEASAWFFAYENDAIVFHLHGLRPGEVAISKIPRSLYERTLGESKSRPDEEPFRSIRSGNYISVRNLFKTED